MVNETLGESPPHSDSQMELLGSLKHWKPLVSDKQHLLEPDHSYYLGALGPSVGHNVSEFQSPYL